MLAGIADGSLIAGTKLPAVRVLAADLGIAPNTVARAYRELEADGILETRGRNGTVIRAKSDDTAALGQLAAQAYAARIRELGLPPKAALAWVRAALHVDSAGPRCRRDGDVATRRIALRHRLRGFADSE